VKRLVWDDEPPLLLGDDIDALLVWASNMGVSDVTLQTDRPVFCELHGRLHQVTKKTLAEAETIDIVNRLYGPNGTSQLAKGEDFDVSYDIRVGRAERKRYRVNATGILSDGRDAVQVTIRPLPIEPPRLEDLDIEPEILGACDPVQGLVVITGPTGSGKSTLLASIIRRKIERPESHRKILTYEQPIEYVYDKIRGSSSIIAQTEIPRHLPSFAAGIRNAMRRKPGDILVGESRDPETMAASAEASNTGHAVYTTLHSNGVAETVRRMISVFPVHEHASRAIDIMESLRLIVTQALLPRAGGGRVGVREFLIFNEAVRDHLLSISPDVWPTETRRLLARLGQPMGIAFAKAHARNLIDRETLNRFSTREALATAMNEAA
jgi:defect-in-organelle-trafficking protein DotB